MSSTLPTPSPSTPVREGRRIGRRLRQSDRLLMSLLRAYGPDRFQAAAPDRGSPLG